MPYVASDIPNRVGFCNRLFKWEMMHWIASRSGLTVLVDWPEWSDVWLPLTEFGHPDKTFSDLDTRALEAPVLASGNYLCADGWDFQRFQIPQPESPMVRMRLRESGTQERIQATVRGWVGVHVRRGDFLPPSGFNANTRVPDSWYLAILDQVRGAFPNVPIYLATDGTPEEQEAFRSLARVSGREIFETSVDPKLVDLFALSSCSLIVGSLSTFSMAASRLRGIPLVWPQENDQRVEEGHLSMLSQASP
jgi:hypothetical protein